MIIDIALWLTAISLAVYGVIKKNQILLGAFSFVIFIIGVLIVAWNSVFHGVQYSHVLGSLPLSVFTVWLLSLYIFLISVLKPDLFKDANWYGFSIILCIIGIGYIAGALFFGYGSSQLIFGPILIIISAAFLIMQYRSKIQTFTIVSLVLLNVIILGYMGILFLEYGYDSNHISEIIVKYSFPLLSLFIFFWVYLIKFGIISEKQASILLKAYFTLFVAGALINRLELSALINVNIATGYIKDFVALGEVGTTLCAGIISSLSYKFIG